MEDTPLLRRWIARKITKYSRNLGLIEEPILVYNYKEMVEKGLKPDAHDRRLMSTKVGNTWINIRSKKPDVMHINIKHHDDKEELENTIAHELLHIRFPIMEHGEEFWTRLGMVLMGKKYGKVKKK